MGRRNIDDAIRRIGARDEIGMATDIFRKPLGADIVVTSLAGHLAADGRRLPLIVGNTREFGSNQSTATNRAPAAEPIVITSRA